MHFTLSREQLEAIAGDWFKEYDEHRRTGSLGESIADEFMQKVVKPMNLPENVYDCISRAVHTYNLMR
jgi:hypothetical protein